MKALSILLLVSMLVFPIMPGWFTADTANVSELTPSPMADQVNAENVDYIGSLGGGVHDVAVQGNYAYLAEGSRLVILDITQVDSLKLMGKYGPLPAMISNVTVSGSTVYLGQTCIYVDGCVPSVRAIDISDPTHPIEVGSYSTWGGQVVIEGNYAHFLYQDTLHIVDISDPTAMHEVGSVYTHHSTTDLAVSGQHAYITWYYADYFGTEGGLLIYDLTNPASPVKVADVGLLALGVAVAGNLAFVDADGVVIVYNVADPGSPLEIAHYYFRVGRMAYSGGYLYSIDGTFLDIYDFSDPLNAYRVSRYVSYGWIMDIAVTGGYVYLANTHNLKILDVTDPQVPVRVGLYRLNGPARAVDVAIMGNYAYVADATWSDYVPGLRVIDVSDPSAMREVGSLLVEGDAGDIEVSGSYAFLAVSGHGVDDPAPAGIRIIDISDPAHPVEIGFYNLNLLYGSANAMSVAGNYIYIAAGEYGLFIVDISDPAHPGEVSRYDTPSYAVAVKVAGAYAYVADAWTGLHILDVSDPTHPVEVGLFPSSERIYAVEIANNYAYIPSSSVGLRIVDISDPTHPVETGSLQTELAVGALAVAGDFAYLSDDFNLLRVLDISDPYHPAVVGSYELPDSIARLTAKGSFAMVADFQAGLVVLKYTGVRDATQGILVREKPETSFVGQPFQVTVEPIVEFGAPGGVITVTLESEAMTCTATLEGGIGSCPFTLDAVGVYTITATYSGDGYFMPAAGAGTHQVVVPRLYYLPVVGKGSTGP